MKFIQKQSTRILLACLFTILFLGNSSINANERPSVDSVLEAIQSTYSIGKTYKIPLKQTTKYKGFKQTLKGNGEIRLSPKNAVRMARLEQKHGVQSTYTILLSGQFYNPFEEFSKFIWKSGRYASVRPFSVRALYLGLAGGVDCSVTTGLSLNS